MRFMSAAEVKKFIADKPLRNTTDHKKQGSKTDSVGFCFMPVDGQEKDGVLYAARRLCGIAITHYCLVGELAHDRWRKGYGVYGDYNNLDKDGFAPPIEHPEVSTKRYSREDFEHFRIYEPDENAIIDAPDMPPLVAAFVRNSSVVWYEPRIIHCSCLDLDCVKK